MRCPRSRVILFWCILLPWLAYTGSVRAQAVETYAGHQRLGIDLMWFRNFNRANGDKTPFLFFSRNRASVAYDQAPTAFGSTNAVSYSFRNGIGLVTVASFLNSGLTPKAGVQFVKQKKDFLFFGWLVADLRKSGNIDLFGLFRYQPSLGGPWRLFTQAELFPVYNPERTWWNLTERVRVGIKCRTWATGLMADFSQAGSRDFSFTQNLGGFLRHEF